MPELPEVQIVRRFLENLLLKPKPKKIKNIQAFYPGIIKQIQPSTFLNKLSGQTFREIDRYGKYLILKLDDYSIISHLRMEGKYIFYDKKYIPEKHDHIVFQLTDGNHLVYNDVRKFGTMNLVNKGQEFTHPSIRKLGPQVNNADTCTFDYFAKVCSSGVKHIKEVILDQEKICGIGNIYADEILYESGIHPQRKCNTLNANDIKEILRNGKIVIDNAIEGKGTTIKSFSSNHQAGSYQNQLSVYGKQGQPCYKCERLIQKIKVGGRGTHFCANCQK